MTAPNNTPVKIPSKLETILAQWKKDGERVDTEGAKVQIQAIQKASEKVKQAEEGVKKAKAAESKAAEDLIRMLGPTPIILGGKKLLPTCRGERVFYKSAGEKEAVSLDG
jgi:hypothetical protein